MIEFSERLKLAIEYRGITSSDLAKGVGISKSNIGRYLDGKYKARTGNVYKMAKFLHISEPWLAFGKGNMTDVFEEDSNETTSTANGVVTIPILTPAAAGFGKYADNEVIGYETVPAEWVNPYDEYRLIQVDGDSMFPKFEDKDYVLVRKQDVVDSGSYAIVIIDEQESVIKKVTYGNGWVELISTNPMYPIRRFEGSEVQRVRVFGLVKRSIRIY